MCTNKSDCSNGFEIVSHSGESASLSVSPACYHQSCVDGKHMCATYIEDIQICQENARFIFRKRDLALLRLLPLSMDGFLKEFAAGADEILVHKELFGERLRVDEHPNDGRIEVAAMLI